MKSLQACIYKLVNTSFFKSVEVSSIVKFNLLVLLSKNHSHLKVNTSVNGLNFTSQVTTSGFKEQLYSQDCKNTSM